MRDHMGISEFYRLFPTEEAWAEFIAQERWRDKPQCPHCKAVKVYKVIGAMGFKCGGCLKHFSVRTGTMMAGSKLPLQTWLLAFYMTIAAKKGISSVQLAKELGVT